MIIYPTTTINLSYQYNYREGTTGKEVFKNDLDISKIIPKLTRKNDIFDEPFIFFYPQIINKNLNIYKQNDDKIIYYNDQLPIMYYEYVAFNEGRFSKKAIFKKLCYINRKGYNSIFDKTIKNVSILSEIPSDELIKLKKFILQQRQQDPTFCKTIYTAIEEELERRTQ